MFEPKTHRALLKAQELWDHPGDLAPHEQALLASVHRITMACIRVRAEAQRAYGYGSKTYLGVAHTTAEKEREDLTKALEQYEEALEKA